MQTLERDGYRLAYETRGGGPRVVWVDPALGSSAMRPLTEAIDALRGHCEVVTYDRRGRGRNEPIANLSGRDEIDDLRALIDHLGGAAAVLGFSSGGALAIHAAAAGLEADRLVLLEPAVDTTPDTSGLAETIGTALADGRPEQAVLHFYEATGVPEEIVAGVTGSAAWPQLVGSAATLLSDLELAYVDEQTLADVRLPVDVIVSEGSPREITAMSTALAERVDADVWPEPGGWHGVDADALTRRLQALLAV